MKYMDTEARLNSIFAASLVDELSKLGVTDFVIAPGGQSTPLVVAASRHPRIKTTVHYDERGAAFYALGLGRATGRPAVVVSTSGTAVANFYPAVIEAQAAKEPLIVISADLALEKSDCGVNQSIEQRSIFSSYPKWEIDLPPPSERSVDRSLLTALDQAYYQAVSESKGPVHINCRFHSPTVDSAVVTDFYANQGETSPATSYKKVSTTPSTEVLEEIAAELLEAERGLVVLGQLPSYADTASIDAFLEKLSWPVVDSVLGQLRFNAVNSSDKFANNALLYLGHQEVKPELKPDYILHLGGDLIFHVQGEPIKAAIVNYLKDCDSPYLVVSSGSNRQDPFQIVTSRIEAEVSQFCSDLMPNLDGSSRSGLLDAFNAREADTDKLLADVCESSSAKSELTYIRGLISNLPHESGLFLGNSLPIREIDLFSQASERDVSVGSLHGVKGIDGTIASGAGFAAGLNRPTTIVCGDISFLHDLNSLPLISESEVPITLVVVNNSGGAIFSFVPARGTAEFSKYFLTEHDFQFSGVCAQFGIEYSCPKDIAEFSSVFKKATEKTSVIELRVEREELVCELDNLFKTVHGQLA